MTFSSRILVIIVISLTTLEPAHAQISCAFEKSAEVHRNDQKIEIKSWTLRNRSELFSTDFQNKNLLEHERWVRSSHPADMPYGPLRALSHHINIIQVAQLPEEYKASEIARTRKSLELGKLLIRKLTCLESLLFEAHIKFIFPKHTYSEVGAIILRSADKRTLRVHFISERDGNGTVSMSLLNDHVDQDLARGFKRWIHFHSHPFGFDNPYRDYAPIGPSEGDLETFIGSDYPIAVVTDGIHSFPMNREHYRSIYFEGNKASPSN